MTDETMTTLRAEADEFQRARHLIESREGVSDGIEIMLELAFRARNAKISEWATQYMHRRLGVMVGVIDDEAQAKAG